MKPLIEMITDEVQIKCENQALKVVQSVGFNVDKERLEKALMDSRSFYNEGYEDAKKEYEKPPMKPIETEWNDYLCPHCKDRLYNGYFIGINDYKFCYSCGGKLERIEGVNYVD